VPSLLIIALVQTRTKFQNSAKIPALFIVSREEKNRLHTFGCWCAIRTHGSLGEFTSHRGADATPTLAPRRRHSRTFSPTIKSPNAPSPKKKQSLAHHTPRAALARFETLPACVLCFVGCCSAHQHGSPLLEQGSQAPP